MPPRAPSPPRPPPPPPETEHLLAPTSAANSKPPFLKTRSSYLSSTRSNEADDEHSSFDTPAESTMGPPARYVGEDISLTTKKELAGFYVYGWAAEVFVVCGIGSFIPITLEQLARENGVLVSDRTTPCTTTYPLSSPISLSTFKASSDHGSPQCVVDIFGTEINTASFAMYTFSISVFIQALLIISMSGAADHGQYRKMFLLIFALTGAIATMLFLPVNSHIYLVGALLAIVANTCFGASFVLLNSFLPLLVRFHPTIQYSTDRALGQRPISRYRDGDGVAGAATEETPLIIEAQVSSSLRDHATVVEGFTESIGGLVGNPPSSADLTVPNPITSSTPSEGIALSTRISSYGIGIGYIAAVIVQIVGILIVLQLESSTFSLRLVLFFIGAWWFAFSIPAAFWLRTRPGPPLGRIFPSYREAFVAYFSYSWRSLGRTVVRARNLKDVVLFLAGWFLLSDSIATVGGTAVLFAKTSLEMNHAALALISVIGTLSGVIGAFTWSKVSALLGLRPTQTVMACLCLFELIPLYGLLGYVPAIRRLGVFGLQQAWEMYPLGAIWGFALGGLSSYCRSLFGELIPPGYEAAFYALYAITDKGSSIFGPAIVGAITDATGEIRPAFFFLAGMVALTFPFMMLVDVERGRRDGSAMAKELEDTHAHETMPDTTVHHPNMPSQI